ncbi:GlsB/YeaQ/YmgE family stress response membrane protein [Candidatus Amarolinea dominans]|uniref:GlsB/YeaQ/YmgE family stress response membrane protein n=1 Tax=Candidatus Amarolinea dominans TaxID=3140696 RepID=UPI0031371FAD|nr:GlsB/YeaQ/YmgE family stress response membrane protein [Anaerolineae bacterium]
MGILAWIVVGLIAGWLASQVMRGGSYGVIGDIILGVVGAVIGGFLAANLLNMPDAVNGINVTSILVAFVGAVILIAILRMVSGRRR